MSDNEFNLDLEPTPDKKPAPVLKRTPARKRVARPTRAAHAAPAAKPGKAARWLGWIVSPRFYYAAAFFIAGYLIYAMYNPGWGAEARTWPHEALGLAGGTFTWDFATAKLLILIVLALFLLIAVCLKPGRTRGVLTLLAAAAALTACLNPSGAVVLCGLALTGGALLLPKESPRAATLLIGLTFLAAHLFMPWEPGRFTRGIDVAPQYMATAFDTIDAFAQPKPGVVEAKGWPTMILERLEPSVALLLAGVGLLALLGAGGRWARWATGVLLLLLCFGTLAHLYCEGAAGADEAFQAGAAATAKAWFGLAAAYVLALAAAVADLAVARGARS